MIEAIRRPKLVDVVADRLKAYIVERGLKPGDRLPTEAQLATSFGVSRLSLREATKSLGFLGILEAKPGRGLTVGRINMDRVTHCLGFHPQLQDADPEVLIDTRVVIETGVLPHVSRRMQQDPAIHPRLTAINDEMSRTKSLTQFVELDLQFHRTLIEASGLTPLLAFAEVLSVFFRKFRESIKKAEWAPGIADHQAVIDFLQAGRVDRAAERLRLHIESHKERLRDAL